MSLVSRRQRRQNAIYRWAALGLLAALAIGLVLPVQVVVRPGSALAARVFSSRNCRSMLRQAVPLLGVHLETAGIEPTAAEIEAASEPSSHGVVGWLFGLFTGISLGEPVTFLTADLPLARGPYAGIIITSGRELASSGGSSSGSGGSGASGSGGTEGAGQGGGLEPGRPAGAEPTDGQTTGGPEGVLEDQDAQLYRYGSGDPVIAIVHTHGSESFLPAVETMALAQNPKADTSKLEAFTTDRSANMLRVGEELARYLATTYGIPVVQSRRLHDAQSDGFRLGAYERSLETETEIVRRYPTVRILLDLHRDAPARDKTTTVIGGVSTATICVIVGTDKLLPNPHWEANYDFARRLVATMEQNYPGISRGILVRDERYNQHVMERTVLLEVGGQENTLEEEYAAIHDLGDVLAQILAEGLD